ncbi:MAG: hypothetical protein ACYC4S_19075 [Rhodoferax sp.]
MALQNVVDQTQALHMLKAGDAQMGDGVAVAVEPDWDLAAQPAPDYEADQRINW